MDYATVQDMKPESHSEREMYSEQINIRTKALCH